MRIDFEQENKARPIIEENMKGVDTFVTLSAGGYVETKAEKADALDLAEDKLIKLMKFFYNKNQL